MIMPNPAIVDAGRIRPVYRGTWSAEGTYEFFDVVKHTVSGSGTSSYIYLSPTAGSHIAPNSSNSANPWELVAAGGANGAQGEPGTTPDITALQYIIDSAVACGNLGGAVNVSGAVDFDDYTTPNSLYYIYATAFHTHAPFISYQASTGKYTGGWLIVLRSSGGTNIRQVWFPITGSTFAIASRLYNGSTWGEWRTETSSPITFVSTTGLDLNDYISNGAYAFTTTAASGGSNFPVALAGILYILGNSGTNYKQIYIDYNNRIYLRQCGGSTFGAWARITAPYAQTAAGIGQYLSVDVAAGSAYSLPSGGTWEYDIFAVNSSGAIVGHAANVKAGGTEIFAGDANKAYYGHVKRVY